MSIESLKFSEKYELACKRGEEESLQNVVRKSFEKALIVVQTTLEAEDVKVHRNVYTIFRVRLVPKVLSGNRSFLLGGSCWIFEAFLNPTSAQGTGQSENSANLRGSKVLAWVG